MSMKNSNDTIGNLTHDLLVAIAVPQQTVPRRAATIIIIIIIIIAVATATPPIADSTGTAGKTNK
jgi:hypothetical protein